MFCRWLTRRCREGDLPSVKQTKSQVKGFLVVQERKSSGTEQFNGRPPNARGPTSPHSEARADSYTFHAGNGRGVRWEDKTRGVLWLCCCSDQHDAGYQHAIDLLDTNNLYPELDPNFDLADGAATTAWGDCVDEDTIEFCRLTYELIETIQSNMQVLDAGKTIVHQHLGRRFAEVTRSEDLTTLRLSRQFAYAQASTRNRFLTDAEAEDIFAQITGDTLTERDYEWEIHPYDAYWITVHFYGDVIEQTEWLSKRAAEAVDSPTLRLPIAGI